MSDPVDALVLDLLDWIGPHARPYAEVMDAWRTSCPRLPVWEEANSRGYLEHQHVLPSGSVVSVSARGLVALYHSGRWTQQTRDAAGVTHPVRCG